MKIVDDFLNQFLDNNKLNHSPLVVHKLFERKIEDLTDESKRQAVEYLQQRLLTLEKSFYDFQKLKKLSEERRIDWKEIPKEFDLDDFEVMQSINNIMFERIDHGGFSSNDDVLKFYNVLPIELKNNVTGGKIIESIMDLHSSYTPGKRKNLFRQVLKDYPELLILAAAKVCKSDWQPEEKYVLFRENIEKENVRESLAEFEVNDFLDLRKKKVVDELFALYLEHQPIQIVHQAEHFESHIEGIQGEAIMDLLKPILEKTPNDLIKSLHKVDLEKEQKQYIYDNLMTEERCELLHNPKLLKHLGSSRIKYYKHITENFPERARDILKTVLHEEDCKTIQECWGKLVRTSENK